MAARVGDEYVEPAEAGQGLLKHPLDVRRVRRVAGDDDRGVTEVGRHRLERLGPASGQRDLAALGDEPAGRRRTDTRAAAGDEHRLSREPLGR